MNSVLVSFCLSFLFVLVILFSLELILNEEIKAIKKSEDISLKTNKKLTVLTVTSNIVGPIRVTLSTILVLSVLFLIFK